MNRKNGLSEQKHLLKQRLGDLTCILSLAQFLFNPEVPLSEIFQEFTKKSRAAFSDPENTQVRVSFRNMIYEEGVPQPPCHNIRFPLFLDQETCGAVEFNASRNRDELSEAILPEELWLLETIALHVNRHIEFNYASTALQNSERRLAEIIDFLPDATFAIDMKGKVIIWNRAMEAETGVKAGDILGKGDYEHALSYYNERRPLLADIILRSDPEIEKTYNFLIKEDNLYIVEKSFRRENGQSKHIWAKARVFYNQAGEVVGAIETIRDITQHKEAEKDLEIKSAYLEETNTALKVLLQQRENDRNEMEGNVLGNIQKLVLPHIDKLYVISPDSAQKALIKTVKTNLENVISPFLRNIGIKNFNLTPREIQIAGFIKEGKTSKEIAQIINTSVAAVNFHRNSLRRKFGLNNSKKNLRTFLLSHS